MSASLSASRPRRRRSQQVALVLLGTAGVVGLAAVYDAWRDAAADDSDSATAPAPVAPVSADQVYVNNAYIPGVGYYHAPYQAWFPHPFNYHDPARGYFAGGLWQPVPWLLASMQSQPSNAAVAAALAAQQRPPEPAAPVHESFGRGGARFARPAAPAPFAPRPGILRGGFGFSAHPSGG